MKKRKIIIAALAVCSVGLLGGCGDTTVEDELQMYSECVEIGDYIGVEYVPESREVTQDDIDSEIDSFCDDNSESTEDYESAIADGDTVNITYVETVDGEEYDSYTDEEGYDIVIGDEELADGLDEQLIGLTPGTEATLYVTYAEDYDDTTVAGMEAEFEITINYITVTTVPEYTDDLVNTATDGEYTTTDEYTAYLTEQLQNDVDEEADETEKTNILQTIIDDSTFVKYPETQVEEYVTGIMTDIYDTAESYGIDVETFLTYFYGYDNEADFLSYMQEMVESVMQERMVISAIAVENDLYATDDDISDYKAGIMEDYEIEESEISEYYSDFDITFYATEEKVLDYIVENAVQVESTEESEDADETEDNDDASDVEDTEDADDTSDEAEE